MIGSFFFCNYSTRMIDAPVAFRVLRFVLYEIFVVGFIFSMTFKYLVEAILDRFGKVIHADVQNSYFFDRYMLHTS